MAKPRKPAPKTHRQESAAEEFAPFAPPRPLRRPALLAISILLFALWFVFLLVTALAR